MKAEHNITIRPDGSVEFIHDDELAAELTDALGGAADKQRASHVEPTNILLRWAFHLVRRRVSDGSRLAEWTRGWRCEWRARIFDGPMLGPFDDRQAAIDAEVEWLLANKL